VTPALMERPRSGVDETTLGWSSSDHGSQPVPLTEEWPASRGPLPRLSSIGSIPKASEADADHQGAGPIRFTISSPVQGEMGSHRLRSSFKAISRLRSQRSAGDWVEAAATLKQDAVRLRNTHYARHSSVLLALADALTFTEPSDLTLDAQATSVFNHSLSLLNGSYVSEPDEEAFLIEMLSHGWNLSPSADLEAPED
jgi:hypothetical protein